MQMGGSDMGDLGRVAAILISKLGTAVMGMGWQISGTMKKHLFMLNYYAIHHLTTKNQALFKHISQAFTAQYHTSDVVSLALLAANHDGSSSLRSSWLSMGAL